MVALKLQKTYQKPEADTPEKPKKDSLGRTYGTGRRKSAIARVWIKSGSGQFSVNSVKLQQYFPHESLHTLVNYPFTVIGMESKFDVFCTVKGGGHSGQAGAIQLGIARAIKEFDIEYHPKLREHGLLTRDSRVVERKKYGRHKARKGTQFSKR